MAISETKKIEEEDRRRR